MINLRLSSSINFQSHLPHSRILHVRVGLQVSVGRYMHVVVEIPKCLSKYFWNEGVGCEIDGTGKTKSVNRLSSVVNFQTNCILQEFNACELGCKLAPGAICVLLWKYPKVYPNIPRMWGLVSKMTQPEKLRLSVDKPSS